MKCMKWTYIYLFFSCIGVLACIFLYVKGETSQDTNTNAEQYDILAENKEPGKETESPEETETSREENVEETEMESEEITAEAVIEKLRSIDFTIKEYPIDTEIYTEEMDREYKEVFLQVLLNQIPVQCEDGEEIYFEDIDPVKEKIDSDHMTMIKEHFLYCYLDFDGDGLPELVVDPRGAYVRFGGPRIFKYDRDSKKVYVDGYRYMRYRPLCAGKFYYAYEGEYGYQEIDSQGNVIEEVNFALAYPWYEYAYKEPYVISWIGHEWVDLEDLEIDKKSWDEVTHDFFEAIDNAVTEVTFDELFSGIEHP